MDEFKQRFEFQEVISMGSRALIRSAYDRETEQKVVLKMFDKKWMSPDLLDTIYQEKVLM